MSKQEHHPISPCAGGVYSNMKYYGSDGYRPIIPPVSITIQPALFDHMHRPHELPEFMRPRSKETRYCIPYTHL